MRARIRAVLMGLAACIASASSGAADGMWRKAAEQHDVDPVVLYALALQESRRLRPDGQVRPWPWTLNAKGHGALYFDTYEAARDKLLELIGNGLQNVDIGLMQINWGANGALMPNPAMILLPEHNVNLGATILRRELDRADGDLAKAIGWYHSPTRERARRYSASVRSIVDNLGKVRGFREALVQ